MQIGVSRHISEIINIPDLPSEKQIMKSRTKQVNSFSVQGLNVTQSNGTAYPSISSAYWQPAPNPTPYLVPGNEIEVIKLFVYFDI